MWDMEEIKGTHFISHHFQNKLFPGEESHPDVSIDLEGN